VEQLLELTIPIYAKYFSKEKSRADAILPNPSGPESIVGSAANLVEMQTESMTGGRNAGPRAMIEVLDEHPDLKKALEEASASPKN